MANVRVSQMKKKAYCHVVGLGLGVWMLTEDQAALMLEVYYEVDRDPVHGVLTLTACAQSPSCGLRCISSCSPDPAGH